VVASDRSEGAPVLGEHRETGSSRQQGTPIASTVRALRAVRLANNGARRAPRAYDARQRSRFGI
jgi:hypothetical protein